MFFWNIVNFKQVAVCYTVVVDCLVTLHGYAVALLQWLIEWFYSGFWISMIEQPTWDLRYHNLTMGVQARCRWVIASRGLGWQGMVLTGQAVAFLKPWEKQTQILLRFDREMFVSFFGCFFWVFPKDVAQERLFCSKHEQHQDLDEEFLYGRTSDLCFSCETKGQWSSSCL